MKRRALNAAVADGNLQRQPSVEVDLRESLAISQDPAAENPLTTAQPRNVYQN
jgi:hypothetical protein